MLYFYFCFYFVASFSWALFHSSQLHNIGRDCLPRNRFFQHNVNIYSRAKTCVIIIWTFSFLVLFWFLNHIWWIMFTNIIVKTWGLMWLPMNWYLSMWPKRKRKFIIHRPMNWKPKEEKNHIHIRSHMVRIYIFEIYHPTHTFVCYDCSSSRYKLAQPCFS